MFLCLRGSFFLVSASLLLMSCSETNKKSDIIDHKCSRCHTSDVVYNTHTNYEDWKRILYGMKMRGLELTPQEEHTILDFLKYNQKK